MALEQLRRLNSTIGHDEIARVSATLSRLGRVIARAGLTWSITTRSHQLGGLDNWLTDCFSRLDPDWRHEKLRRVATDALVPFLILGGQPQVVHHIDLIERRLWPYDAWFIEPGEQDPIELLSQLWLPDRLAKSVAPNTALGDRTSLFHFLFSGLACPKFFDGEDQLSIALFAAACVVQPGLERDLPIPFGNRNLNLRRDADRASGIGLAE